MEIDSGNSDPPTPIDPELLAKKLPDISISTENCNSVYFDLETSGFGKNSEILQIAAKFEDHEFNMYLKPSKPIHPKASEKTGLKNICGELYLDGKRVPSISPREALEAFQKFLDLSPKPCVLVAHNAFSFDAPHLLQLIINTNMIESLSKIAGFSDTLIVFRRNYPERKQDKPFTLRALAQDLLHLQSDRFHEALYDVEILEKLVSLIKKEDLYAICKPYKELIMSKIRLSSLELLKSVVSNAIFKKIATAGINFEMLQRKLRESGEEGVKNLLSEELASNKPRVTKSKKVIIKIYKALRNSNS